jgi:hypothetical protein
MDNPQRSLVAASLLLVTALVNVGCSSEPELQFADWLFPVPEGTPIKEYGPVPLEGRDESTVQLIDDLTIGADLSNPAAVLYQPAGVTASEDGTIYVADRGANDIKMFAADGTYLKTFGNEGQGPGEFGSVSAITVAGEFLVARDLRNRRFSVWTLGGEHVADHVPTSRSIATSMQGLADGTLVSYSTERAEDRTGTRVVVRSTLKGEELSRLFAQAIPAPVLMERNEPLAILQSALDSFDEPRITMRVGAREVVYVTPLHEYQVLAMSPDGTGLWALRVAWPRLPWPEVQKQPMIDSFLENFEVEDGIAVDDFEWPDHTTALGALSTDGAGRLYVFPTPDAVSTDPPETWPVDVYSPAGDFVTAGTIPFRWSYALGNYVYGTRPDENDEIVVVRYRLIVNDD